MTRKDSILYKPSILAGTSYAITVFYKLNSDTHICFIQFEEHRTFPKLTLSRRAIFNFFSASNSKENFLFNLIAKVLRLNKVKFTIQNYWQKKLIIVLTLYAIQDIICQRRCKM